MQLTSTPCPTELGSILVPADDLVLVLSLVRLATSDVWGLSQFVPKGGSKAARGAVRTHGAGAGYKSRRAGAGVLRRWLQRTRQDVQDQALGRW